MKIKVKVKNVCNIFKNKAVELFFKFVKYIQDKDEKGYYLNIDGFFSTIYSYVLLYVRLMIFVFACQIIYAFYILRNMEYIQKYLESPLKSSLVVNMIFIFWIIVTLVFKTFGKVLFGKSFFHVWIKRNSAFANAEVIGIAVLQEEKEKNIKI